MTKPTDMELLEAFQTCQKLAAVEEMNRIELDRLELRLATLRDTVADNRGVRQAKATLHGMMVDSNMKLLQCGNAAAVLTSRGIEIVEGIYLIGDSDDTASYRPTNA
jgi:hypothetical protein